MHVRNLVEAGVLLPAGSPSTWLQISVLVTFVCQVCNFGRGGQKFCRVAILSDAAARCARHELLRGAAVERVHW
jgi:hypothetical protein